MEALKQDLYLSSEDDENELLVLHLSQDEEEIEEGKLKII